jgi:hypothetical protein
MKLQKKLKAWSRQEPYLGKYLSVVLDSQGKKWHLS